MNIDRRSFLGSSAAFFIAGCRTTQWFGAPRLSFGVISDVHITTPSSTRLFKKALSYYKKRGVDAVMIPGDLTDWGLKSSYQYMAEAWRDVFANTEVKPLFCTGNHDFDGWRYADMTMEMHANGYSEDEHITNFGQKKCWEEIFGEEYSEIRVRTVKGYDFISAEWRGSGKLPKFMSENSARFSGSKPFFFFQHLPIQGTTSDSNGWADGGVGYEALKAFPNAIAFTGHTHRPFIDERSLWQGEFTAISVPSLSYASFDSKYENSPSGISQTMPPIQTRRDLRGGQGYFVSVYDDKMVVERIDFDEGCSESAPTWVVPFGVDGHAEQKRRADESRAPSFPQGATIETETRNTRNRRGNWAIALNCTFPSAHPAPGESVFEYELKAVPRDGSEPLVKHFVSPAYPYHPKREPTMQRFWFDVRELPQAKEYVIEVRARNSFGKESEPIFSRVWKGEAGLDKVRRVCLTLTFDDALKSHLTIAAPILEKYGFTGCFNICTDSIGKNRCLTWDDVRELKRRGHEIASHGKTHANLVKLLAQQGPDAVRAELIASRDAIAEALGEPPTLFCHPYIALNPQVNALIRECGMTPFLSSRVNTGSSTTPKAFAERLDKWIESRKSHVDLLFHGLSRETGGYSPISDAPAFEEMIKAIAERKARDVAEVTPYSTYIKWFSAK